MIERWQRLWRRTAAPVPVPGGDGPPVQWGLAQFSFFAGFVVLRGWVHSPGRRLVALGLEIDGGAPLPIPRIELPSIDGPAEACGFAARLDTGLDAFTFRAPVLVARFDDDSVHRLEQPGIAEVLADRGHRLYPLFCERLRTRPPGRLLEIGARARSGITRRDAAPAGWDYVGLDIVDGPNVDVVGDAHRLQQIFPPAGFDAVMSLAVFEHLAMPWKAALQINHVLRTGGLAFIQTHQSFPLHEQPWDFWRISADAWPALFNARTGFRVLEVGMAEPLMFVARRWHPGVNYHEASGCAVSSVIVEKTGDSTLRWDAGLEDCLAGTYPQ